MSQPHDQFGRKKAVTEFDDAIFELIASGMSLGAALSSDPRFPTYGSFQPRVSRDPVLRARMADARARSGSAQPRPVFREFAQQFDSILDLIESGSAIEEALVTVFGPRRLTATKCMFFEAVKKNADFAVKYRAASRKRQAGPNRRAAAAWYDRQELINAAQSRSGDGPHRATLLRHAKKDSELRSILKPGHTDNELHRLLHQNDLFRKARRLLPGRYDDHRQDQIQDAILFALEYGDHANGAKIIREFYAGSLSPDHDSLDDEIFDGQEGNRRGDLIPASAEMGDVYAW